MISMPPPRHRLRAEGRFVRERDAAIASLLDERPMSGETLEVEVREGVGIGRSGRPDITILWENERPLAARLGASVLVQASVDPRSRTAISDAARAKGLSLETMGETRLWKLLGVPS
jgi:hypothetical protein